MKNFKFILSLSLLFSCYIANVNAAVSSIMIDAKSGNVLYEENADKLRYPASLTKLMTLYLTFSALENGSLKLYD